MAAEGRLLNTALTVASLPSADVFSERIVVAIEGRARLTAPTSLLVLYSFESLGDSDTEMSNALS